MSPIRTEAPASARRRAVALPSPQAAPVTTAVRPARETISLSGLADRSGIDKEDLLFRWRVVGGRSEAALASLLRQDLGEIRVDLGERFVGELIRRVGLHLTERHR